METALKMADFDDEGYKYMICVEPGAVSKRVTQLPGTSCTYTQKVSLSN